MHTMGNTEKPINFTALKTQIRMHSRGGLCCMVTEPYLMRSVIPRLFTTARVAQSFQLSFLKSFLLSLIDQINRFCFGYIIRLFSMTAVYFFPKQQRNDIHSMGVDLPIVYRLPFSVWRLRFPVSGLSFRFT